MIRSFLFTIIFLASSTATAGHSSWQTLTPGIRYHKTETGPTIHTFEIDLKKHSIKLQHNYASNRKSPITQLIDPSKENIIIGLNGGFFDKQNQPIGYRFYKQKLQSHKSVSWYRYFYITKTSDHAVPHISSQPTFLEQSPDKTLLALQSGPQLIRHGRPVKGLKEGLDARSAIGFKRDKKLLISITQDRVSLTKFSSALRNVGYSQAINLDGGHSAQLYAKVNGFKLNLTKSLYGIVDAIVIQ